ncbi:MAG TPA: hypothetical protein VJ824_04120, partial [Bacillota bacterium]|nr:hypothetical protein [Bacillota bacterium]
KNQREKTPFFLFLNLFLGLFFIDSTEGKLPFLIKVKKSLIFNFCYTYLRGKAHNKWLILSYPNIVFYFPAKMFLFPAIFQRKSSSFQRTISES